MRKLHFFDRLIAEVEHGLASMTEQFQESVPSPGKIPINPELTSQEIRVSQGLMRVNHTGEICAQALYRGQALATQDPSLRTHLHEAAREEVDHLLWCGLRLEELNTFKSRLNPFWYLTSFLIGYCSARAGDGISLGFVEETEQQVSRHLTSHQSILPQHDHKSRAIVDQMKRDEERHAAEAHDKGAEPLSGWMKRLMALQAKIMTRTAYFL